MSAAVGAALKKIAVVLFTNPRALKIIGGIVLGVIIALITPILAVIAVFNGGIRLDTEKLQQMVTENLSAADQAMLLQVENTMYAIEEEMTERGFPDRTREAQILYILALEKFAGEPDFVSKLAGCFAADQTDEQLMEAVNTAFGTELSAEEFGQVMGDIRGTTIDASDRTDTTVQNDLDPVRWTQGTADDGWGCVYGTCGDALDEAPEGKHARLGLPDRGPGYPAKGRRSHRIQKPGNVGTGISRTGRRTAGPRTAMAGGVGC